MEQRDREAEATAGEAAEPRPYEPPRIVWEEQVEVRANLAIACGKVPAGGGQCTGAPHS